MRVHLSNHDYEQISAYLDDQLSAKEKARFELQLRDRPEVKIALEDMGRTRTLLRTAPRQRAPRNFTLTPAMVQQRQPKRRTGFTLFPALSFASALAALVLVATILFEQMPGAAPLMTSASPDSARVEATNMVMQEAAPAGTLAEDTQRAAPGIAAVPAQPEGAPPVITWGFPPNSGGPTFGMGGGPATEAMGKGGMGGGGDSMPGVDAGAGMTGNLVVPLEGVESMADVMAEPEQKPAPSFEGIPTIEGAGPILGLPEGDKAGTYVMPVATPLPERDLASEPVRSAPDGGDNLLGLSPLRLAQAVLGFIALITGLAAWLVWRRTR